MRVLREGLKVLGLIASGLLVSLLLNWLEINRFIRVQDQYYSYLIVFIGWVILVFPVGELIGRFLQRWEPVKSGRPGLERAGKVIGQLERTIILIFYLAGSLEGIAFLVVAKSIYRFGDLKKGYDNRSEGEEKGEGVTFSISEYIILGSLLSYGVALIGAITVHLVLSNLGLALNLAP
ncbi:MAG: hypothetical protein ACLFVS_06820 [Candidatus Acetothermia bacterium]